MMYDIIDHYVVDGKEVFETAKGSVYVVDNPFRCSDCPTPNAPCSFDEQKGHCNETDSEGTRRER
jgi:hypothetical protein